MSKYNPMWSKSTLGGHNFHRFGSTPLKILAHKFQLFRLIISLEEDFFYQIYSTYSDVKVQNIILWLHPTTGGQYFNNSKFTLPKVTSTPVSAFMSD